MRRLVVVAVLGGAGLLLTVAGAWAYWTGSGAGGSTATTGTLSAPTSVAAVSTAGTSTVSISWAGASLTTGQPAQGYYVTRLHNGDPFAACGTSPTVLTTALTCDELAVADGQYSYRITAVHHGWTAVSVPSNTITVTNDAAAPAVSVSSISPAPNGNGRNDTSPVTVTLSATDADGSGIASITYSIDGGSSTTVAAATATVSVAGNGTHTVAYFATDNARNASATSTQTVTIDTVPPSVTVDQAAGQADPSSASSVSFAVAFSEAVTGFTAADVTLTGTAGATTSTVTGNGPYTVEVSGMTGSGTVTASVEASTVADLAGNANSASTSTDNTVLFDATPPAAPSAPALTAASDSGSESTDRITNVTTPTFTGTAEAGSTVKLFDGATQVGSGIATGGSYSIATSALANGAHTITATATDAAGNTGPASAGTTVTIDTIAPTVTVNQAPAQSDPTSVSPVAFTATFSQAVTGFTAADVTLTGTAGATTSTVTGNGPYIIATSGMTGSGTVTASVGASTVADLAGNANSASTATDNTVTYTDAIAPAVAITDFTSLTGNKVRVSGTAGFGLGDSATVTVVVCTTITYPCTGTNTKATLTAPVNAATGAWTVDSGPLGPHPSLYARATQADRSGNIGTSNVAGPRST